MDAAKNNMDIVQRGRKLYDITNRTFAFDSSTVYYADFILKVDYDDLPFTAFNYIVQQSKLQFLVDEHGEEEKIKNAKEQTYRAYALLQAAELTSSDPNINNSPGVYRLAGPIRNRNYRHGGL
jgi:hypothetical protein